MIRTVADRLTARIRPAYIGRHRRNRSGIGGVLRMAAPMRERTAQSASGR